MSAFKITQYIIKVFNNFEDASFLWPTGNEKKKEQPCHLIFQTLPFLKAWKASYGEKLKARILLVEIYNESAEPLLFIPLALFKKHGATYLSFPDEGVSDYNAPILFQIDKQWTAQEADGLLRSILSALPDFDILSFHKMPELVGEAVNPFFLLAKQEHKEYGHYMRLDSSWDMIEKHLHRGKNTRQKIRQLQRLGDLQYIAAQNHAQASLILDALIEQKQHRFEQTYVPGFNEHPEKQAFFERATNEFMLSGNLHLSALKLDGIIIATLWGLKQQHSYYGMMISFNAEDWGKYSPGMVLHYYLLRDLYDQGVTKLDLGIGNETWKTGLCNHSTPLRDHVAAHSVRGQFVLNCLNTLEAARNTWLWRKTRPLKWVILRSIKR